MDNKYKQFRELIIDAVFTGEPEVFFTSLHKRSGYFLQKSEPDHLQYYELWHENKKSIIKQRTMMRWWVSDTTRMEPGVGYAYQSWTPIQALDILDRYWPYRIKGVQL